MAPPSLRLPRLILISTLLVLTASNSLIQAQIDHTSLQLALEWPSTTSIDDEFTIADEEELDMSENGIDRRSLYWTRRHYYYISYGALSANRIPCPARSGRSYYTHNCYRASGPVRPYTRGCSTITRCRS